MTDLPVFTIADIEPLTGLDVVEFTADDAVTLGIIGVEVIRELGASLCVAVVVGGVTAFRANLGTTGSSNDPWLAGKAAVAAHFSEPSLLVKRRLEELGETIEQNGLDAAIYRPHGGSYPIRVGGEVIGTITMSGEPDVVDHAATTEAVKRFLAR